MPGVCDPGALLVDWCIKNEVSYDVIAGANAVITAYAMSGFNSSEFTFFGFWTTKELVELQNLKRFYKTIEYLYFMNHLIDF